MRAFWSGEISFGLVTIPAKLYTATKDMTPQFKQLHTTCGSPIAMVRRCTTCNKDVAWEEVGKGYEVSKSTYALFTKDELAAFDADGSGTGTVEIVTFVDPGEVDLAYIDKSYWIGPGGRNVHGYALLRAVMAETKKVALAKVKLRTRTRLALVRPRGKLFSLDVMRFADELVDADELAPADTKPPSDRELSLARHLVRELAGPFDPARHPDEYRSAVLAAVDEKVEAGHVVVESTAAVPAAPAAPMVPPLDLADLLRRSIHGTGTSKPTTATTSTPKPTARPGPAKTRPRVEPGKAAEIGKKRPR
jgi:DNA end-binding protein Ku